MLLEKEKTDLLKFINDLKSNLKRNYSEDKNKIKPFRAFCSYDEETSAVDFYQKRFEGTFDTSGYKFDIFDIVDDSEPASKNEKTDIKDIIKVLDCVIKDEEKKKSICRALLNQKDFRGRPYKLPINGKSFLALFELLYSDCVKFSEQKNVSVFDKNYNENRIKNIIKVLEKAIIGEFYILYLQIEASGLALAALDKMLDTIKNDSYTYFSNEIQDFIFKVFASKDEDKEKLERILSYNEELFEWAAKDNVGDITTLEYQQFLDEQIEDLKVKKQNNEEYFKHVNSFYNGLDSEELLLNLRKAKQDGHASDIKYVMKLLLFDNPQHPPFIKAIASTFGMVTPKTKRIIQKPNNFDDILEIFDCYDEMLSDEKFCDSNNGRLAMSNLKEIVMKIKEQYKNGSIVAQKINTALAQFKNVKKALKNGTQIKINDKNAFVESTFGSINDDENKLRALALNQIMAFKKYNERRGEIVAKRKKAKRFKTDALKQLEKDGIEIVSESLESEILLKKDDKEFLLILERIFDLEYQKYPIIDDYYHKLCEIALVCTDYIREVLSFEQYDDEELKTEINRMVQ